MIPLDFVAAGLFLPETRTQKTRREFHASVAEATQDQIGTWRNTHSSETVLEENGWVVPECGFLKEFWKDII